MKATFAYCNLSCIFVARRQACCTLLCNYEQIAHVCLLFTSYSTEDGGKGRGVLKTAHLHGSK
jgi:hypothetical protein